jgi:hypothetical protein
MSEAGRRFTRNGCSVFLIDFEEYNPQISGPVPGKNNAGRPHPGPLLKERVSHFVEGKSLSKLFEPEKNKVHGKTQRVYLISSASCIRNDVQIKLSGFPMKSSCVNEQITLYLYMWRQTTSMKVPVGEYTPLLRA